MTISEEYKTVPGKTYLYGYPLHGTYSPFLHNTMYRLAGVPRTYQKMETQNFEDILEATKQPDFAGSAVTMPYKVRIVQECADLTPEGRAIGACNTIAWVKKSDGSKVLLGHNTDCTGIRESFVHAGFPLAKKGDAQKPGMIVGGGGASRSAVYALAVYFQCSPIYVVNRDDKEVEVMATSFKQGATADFNPELIHVKTPEEAAKLPAPALVVSCIPDFPPSTAEEKAARATFEAILDKQEKGGLIEMCYHPSPETTISRLAEQKGWHVVTGEKPMIYQGIEQQKLWLSCGEQDLHVEEVVRIVSEQVKQDKASGSAPPDS